MSGISPGYRIGEDANLEAWPNLPSVGSLALEYLAADRPPCTVCGKAFKDHGSYPTCATHAYTPDAHCQTVLGTTCAGAECANGCVRTRSVKTVDGEQR